ncbi:MAG: 2-(1,2-epoxy-1,2-dihydrophenyl)acetyl-CoA isomerase [Deltaproteobacteria bacterium]|nr:2-(1,2-epoxy-1,2-dihydrophenyl)acetyl-CoA isomerase [Deltaproteobacteria bacterium]
MSYETILYDKGNGVAAITLNRPQALNAFTPQMNSELFDALRVAERDEEIRCVMITGAGRAFCAGQDLKGRSREQRGSLGQSLRERYNPIILRICGMEKIVVAAVNGVAAGAGCNLALACDLRIASEDARFIEAFVRVGLAPDCGGSFFLPRLIGLSKAMELLLLGEPVDAKEAHRIGLVTKVVPAKSMASEARELAERIARGPRSTGLIKRAVNRNLKVELENQLEYEAQLQEIAGRTMDFDEGVAAFLEKRSPVFQGK